MRYLIPERLETRRLVLRIFGQEDWKDLYEYYSDEICIKYTIGKVLNPVETWREVAIRAGHWVLRGYGPYAVEEKENGSVIGIVGLWYPEEWPEPEMTWHLIRKYFGKGYAREAARAVISMAKQCLPDISWISLIHPENIGSVKLAKHLNAEFEKQVRFRNGDWHQYRHPQARR